MVPHIAVDRATVTTTKLIITTTTTSMTNSEMESSSNALNNECNSVDMGSTTSLSSGGLSIQGQQLVVFGSQLVDKNSSTPYSDATKVRYCE